MPTVAPSEAARAVAGDSATSAAAATAASDKAGQPPPPPKGVTIRGTRFAKAAAEDRLLPVRDSALNLRAAAPPSSRVQPTLTQSLDPYSQDLTVNSFADFIVKSKSSGGQSAGATARSRFPYISAAAAGGSKRVRRRLVCKNGECNVSHKHIQKVRRQFLADIYTSLVDLKWRYILLICVTAFVSSWLFFGALWWVICYAHGDFEPERPAKVCVQEVHGFTTAFLYSIETQHTIGYGGRQLTDACPEAVVLLMIQSLFGMIMQALTTGMMFAKLARPKKRAETLMFSRHAVICMRDGHLCLMLRIGDMRRSHLVGANVRALVIRRRVSKEGEVLPLDSASVTLGLSRGSGEDRLMIIWPIIVLHRIDESSPFWSMSREDFESENFELIVLLEGVIESTGMTTQARTSYLPGEILWGRRLERLITFQKEDGRYQVDYSRFHSTVPIEMPNCSAKQLRELEQRATRSSRGGGGERLGNVAETQESDTEDNILLIPESDEEV